LEIIMCLTLNSAAEWAGSMFQVVVAEDVVVGAVERAVFSDMLVCSFQSFGCRRAIFVATST
jgi:hypothetical protein